MLHWYRTTAEETLAKLGSDPGTGLSEREAEQRLQHHGGNTITQTGVRSRWTIIAEQFRGLLVWILIAAALFSLAIGEFLESGVILAIVVLNATLGYLQEYRAERALAALRRMTVAPARVLRDGSVREIPADRLVPGDIVFLQAGSLVPADGRLLQSANLRAQEAALTGEAEPVAKDPAPLDSAAVLGDRRNMVHLGTQIVHGHGLMVVTETGMATALGQTAGLLRTVAEEPTPLQRKLDAFGRAFSYAVFGVCIVVVLLGLIQGEALRTVVLTAISLAVAAVPEALTAVVTITLAIGARKMLKRGALIRRLNAVETLGSVRVICADKTGTLTRNRMTVAVLDVADHRLQLRSDAPPEPGADDRTRQQPAIRWLLASGALCNDSLVEQPADGPEFRILGEPTEASLALAAAQLGWPKGDLEDALPRVAEIPFDSDRKRMVTVHRVRNGLPEALAGGPTARAEYLAVAKGALEAILTRCDSVLVDHGTAVLDDGWRRRILAAHDGLASEGMRVLAFAVRPLPSPEPLEHAESRLTFLGLTGIYDPPRPEVREAVAFCRQAGIEPVMITGDHPLTARRIADEIGIGTVGGLLTGTELDRLTADELTEAIQRVTVFARVSPEHKLRLVGAFQRLGWTVAMTGDGVNDAPALKKADIGIAMGQIGTDVAKESAELVLLDDNFATITAAVKEGRAIYDNLVKFILYLLSCNVGEIAVVTVAPFLGMPLPLLPLQILWMNLVTDGLPALALGLEPAEENGPGRRPADLAETLFGQEEIHFVASVGLLMSFLGLGTGFFYWFLGQENWQTMLLTVLIFGQMAVALALRSRVRKVAELGWFTNPALLWAILATVLLQLAVIYAPPLQAAFHTVALSGLDLGVVAAFSLAIFVGTESLK
jgi:Ca2+-transporting ATPase